MTGHPSVAGAAEAEGAGTEDAPCFLSMTTPRPAALRWPTRRGLDDVQPILHRYWRDETTEVGSQRTGLEVGEPRGARHEPGGSAKSLPSGAVIAPVGGFHRCLAGRIAVQVASCTSGAPRLPGGRARHRGALAAGRSAVHLPGLRGGGARGRALRRRALDLDGDRVRGLPLSLGGSRHLRSRRDLPPAGRSLRVAATARRGAGPPPVGRPAPRGRERYGFAFRTRSSAMAGNQAPAAGSMMPHSGSIVDPAAPRPRAHSPSDSPGIFTQR